MKTFGLAALLSAVALPVIAQGRPALPVGDWGREFKGKLLCDRPFLKIEPNLIIRRLEGGEGRCKVTSLKKKSGALWGEIVCDWDKTIPIEMIEMGDDDGAGFSLVVKSATQIMFNNVRFGLCSSSSEVSR